VIGLTIGKYSSPNNYVMLNLKSYKYKRGGFMKKLLFILSFVSMTIIANAQWTAVNTGLPYTSANEFEYFAAIGTDLFVGTSEGVYVTSNNGTSWAAVNTGLTNTDIEVLATAGSNLFAGTGHGIFKSVNNGTSWTAINTGLDTSMGTSVYALFTSGSNLFAGTEAGVFLSTGSYTSWTAVNTGLPQVDFYSFAQSGTKIFAGGLGVYITSNNGTNWAEATSGLPSLYNSDFESFAVLGSDIFAGDLSLGVYKSIDNGTNWTAVNSGLTDLNTQALAVNGTNLFAGGLDGGVFLSNNNGASWTAVNTGLTNLTVLSLEVFGNYLFAGTAGGVFRAQLSSFAGINEIQNENIQINIFPDPNNGLFQVSGNKSQISSIVIYNMLGEKVYSSLFIDKLSPITINITDKPGGMYVVEVKTEKGISVKKFVKE
jgi:ligand-binding sensor domain-containing protein